MPFVAYGVVNNCTCVGAEFRPASWALASVLFWLLIGGQRMKNYGRVHGLKVHSIQCTFWLRPNSKLTTALETVVYTFETDDYKIQKKNFYSYN